MFCNYAGCECILPQQIESACNKCELKVEMYFNAILKEFEPCIEYLDQNGLSPKTVKKLKKLKAEIEDEAKKYLYRNSNTEVTYGE